MFLCFLINREHLRDLQRVLPNARLEGFGTCILKRTDAVGIGIDITALQRVLKVPGLVEILGLEEANETSVCTIGKSRRLVCLEEILPVLASGLVFGTVGGVSTTFSYLADHKVVVTVFECTRKTACHGPEAFVIEIFNRNVSKGFPAIKAATALLLKL